MIIKGKLVAFSLNDLWIQLDTNRDGPRRYVTLHAPREDCIKGLRMGDHLATRVDDSMTLEGKPDVVLRQWAQFPPNPPLGKDGSPRLCQLHHTPLVWRQTFNVFEDPMVLTACPDCGR